MVIKHHRNARVRAQAFPACARSQINTAQVHRHRPDRANAIQAEFDLKLRAQSLKTVEVVEDSSGGFAMDAPEPGGDGYPLQHLSDRYKVKRFAPWEFESVEFQAEAFGVVGQPFTEFA